MRVSGNNGSRPRKTWRLMSMAAALLGAAVLCQPDIVDSGSVRPKPKPAEPEPNRLARSGRTNASAVRANLDDPLIHIRPICSRRRGFEEQEPNGFNAS